MARSVVGIDDLTNSEIENVFALADEFLADNRIGHPPRAQSGLDVARGKIMSTLFFEPSTRTRFSFESAMLRLGGHILSSADPQSTSAAKGETIADMIRVVQNYADIIVLRHPWEGAARVAAEYSDIPVVNAGDGGHEHPTQTLCDLYTLRREKQTLKNLKVLLCGDLKNGRTIHSLIYALARFGARIKTEAAPGFELPDHVRKRLEKRYHCFPLPQKQTSDVDVVYVTPDGPHQPALFANISVGVDWDFPKKRASEIRKELENIDVCYVTRLQVERTRDDTDGTYPVVNQKFLRKKRFEHSKVLHPLPRVTELGYDIDADPRGIYFRQAAYGVPVRMALVASLLGLKSNVLSEARHTSPYRLYSSGDGIECSFRNCVTSQDSEKRYLIPKFRIVSEEPLTLRCSYCEREYEPRFVGRKSARRYTDVSKYKEISDADCVFFATEARAREAGYVKYKRHKRSLVAM